MTDTAPRAGKLTAPIVAQIAAGTVAGAAIGEAPYDATVTSVSFTPNAAITGATATKRTLTLVNKGQSGAWTTVVATLDFVTGVDGVAGDEKAFTLSVVADATKVAEGDVLALVEAVTSTGTANPGGLVQVELASR